MQSASRLFNTTDVYLDDFQYTKPSLLVRSSHELAENNSIPRDLDGTTKMHLVKEHNKITKINPPIISSNSPRPDLTDIEIALIVSSYNTTPISLIQHTLNLSKRTIEDTYNKYKHEPIIQVPLIAISDTSRYLNEENLRYIYDSTDFHHDDDPLTNKELLRQDTLKSNKEESVDSNCYTNYLSQRIEAGATIKSPTRTSGHIFPDKDFTERYAQLYGGTWGDHFETVFTKSILDNITTYTINKSTYLPNDVRYKSVTTSKYNDTVYLPHKNYYINYNNHTPTNLAKTYLDFYNSTSTQNKEVIDEDTYWTQGTAYLLIPLLYNNPNMITNFTFNNKPLTIHNSNYNTTYTTSRYHYQNYKPSDNHLYLQYHILRPSIYDRCIASPLQDSNQELRYTFPKNTYKPLANDKDKYDTTFPAIHCNDCNTFLSKHTSLICECKKLRITVNTLSLDKRTHNVKVKPISINIQALPITLKQKVLKHLDIEPTNKPLTSKLKYAYGQIKDLRPNSTKQRNLYQYTSSIKYQHQFSQNTKTFLQVFQAPSSSFSLHLYNYNHKLKNKHKLFNITPNVLPLYISFNFPLSNTSQEPYVI
jgi:hypothetical protein